VKTSINSLLTAVLLSRSVPYRGLSAHAGQIEHKPRIISPDGIRWTHRESGTENRLQDIAYCNGTFVAVGWNGAVLTSAKGFRWSKRDADTTADLWNITCPNNSLLANIGEPRREEAHSSQSATRNPQSAIE
jgi:hypothetical protein